MKMYANTINANYLRNVLPDADFDVSWAKAAIAYGNDAGTLIEQCRSDGIRLDIWMRYDHTVPVAPSLLRKLLRYSAENIFCWLIPDVLHAKVIWWKNYGAYIGSANLTKRAWVSNIEFGVFLSEDELETGDVLTDLEGFFESLSNLSNSSPLTEEIVENQQRLKDSRSKALWKIDKDSKAERIIPVWNGPAHVSERQSTYATKRTNFVQEWQSGITALRELARKAPSYRPVWLDDDVPATWQADQFLHAYYYNRVVEGNRHPFEKYYLQHRDNPAAATTEALEWWSELDAPPSGEDYNCHNRAPIIRQLLSREHLRNLTETDFQRVCQANHATEDHVMRTGPKKLGLTRDPESSREQRVASFASWLWHSTNRRGNRIVELLTFVLDEGASKDFPSRLFEASYGTDRKFLHFGVNQIGELAGWARPDLYPPRNGRTSKALRALGYDVRVR